ncbi:MAG: YqaJ viral recombinase family protein, partial [Actinobacteria bacterium]|nr:YqaJ viral recombinase family protein [Actinomycetota bacterium]
MTAADAEWHAWRGRGIGSSDIAGLLGLSPWSSPYSVWLEKVGGGGQRETERMRWGRAFENEILDEAARRLGVVIAARQVAATHPRYEWARATLDATYAEQPGAAEAGALEAKMTGDPRWAEVPAYYWVQVQWQMEVRQLPACWVAALHGGSRLSLWLVQRDRDAGAAMLRVAGQF